MKTTNKLKIMAVAMLLGASAQSALAQNLGPNTEGPFTCLASNHQSFSFKLDREPADYDPNGDVVSGYATDLHGMNVAIRSLPINITTNSIHTRTIVGFNYSFILPSGTAVALTNITYAPTSFKNQLGIKGHATLPNGAVVALVCQKM